MAEILWNPSEEKKNSSLVQKFIEDSSLNFNDYFELHKWSVTNIEEFWEKFWSFSGIIHSKDYDKVLSNPVMPGAKWFEGSRLNYAENLLSGNPNQIAIISTGQNRKHNFLHLKI